MGTVFRVFAKDLRTGCALPAEVVHGIELEEIVRISHSGDLTTEDAEREISAGRTHRYLPIYETKKEGDIGGNFVRTPFACWVDTADNRICHELAAYHFPSEFNELHEYYNIDSSSWNDSVEISVDDAWKMLSVVGYILAGDYSRKVESAVFNENQFFPVFERQFKSFAGRFRNATKGRKRGSRGLSDEDAEDYSDAEEIRRKDNLCCQRLRDIFAGFVQNVAAVKDAVDSKFFSYHLAYFK